MAFEWKKLVRSVAPTIAQALGGPLAGLGVQALSDALLGKPDGTEEEVAAALQGASPETLAAIKKADQDFKVKMRELDIDFERLAFDDVRDARAREVEVKDKMPAALAVILVLMFAGALALLFWVLIPEGNKSTIYVMIGSLGTLTITSCQYFHGSSRGSAQKNAALFQQAGHTGKG